MDDTIPDLGSLTDLEPEEVVMRLVAEETGISYKRRILPGIVGRSPSP